ncbi:glycosyltransferase family 2 protein [Limisphaera sp. VF-2]|uniref:glycosyltransferase family 2 protein n=1 Tax=Limisphaera sp. VF-2 TaxID=3400418 RepID=UPI003C19CE53
MNPGSHACLAVIVPCYNEAGTIEEILRRILARPEVAEVVVVDDGSTDDSWQRLQTWSGRDPRLRLLRHPHNRGKGAAIQTALPHLRAPFVLIQDADLEYDPADYPRLLQPLLEGRADAVYGTRFGPGARARTPLWHRGGNWLLTRIARGLTGLPLTDEATGYKVFRRELLQSLTLQERGFGFCPEVTAKLARLGARVVEVPIHYQGRSRAEGKKIRWRDGLEAVRCLWRYSRPPRLPGSSQTPPSLPHAPAEETVSAAEPRRLPGWVWVLPALVYGWGLVWATGLVPEWGRWYSASPYYRQQVAAMLRGDLALSRDPADLSHDLCWSEGGVHQVWGLGVALWRLPFELLARAFGLPPFPDMLALAAALALTAWAVLSALWEFVQLWEQNAGRVVPPGTALHEPHASQAPSRAVAAASANRTSQDRTRANRSGSACLFLGGIAAILLLFFPPFLNQLTTRFLVWEEAVTYEYLVGAGLIAGLIRVAVRPTMRRYGALCALAGFGMFVRPTLVFHGAAAVLAGAFALWIAPMPAARQQSDERPPGGGAKRHWFLQVLGGLSIFVLGGALLYWTNQLRFGHGFEFGHKLNLQVMMGSVYATRFDHPYSSVPASEAAAELFGLLFRHKTFNGWSWYATNLFAGQSATPRWREVASTTYDFAYLVLLLLGWTAGALAFRSVLRRWRKEASPGKSSYPATGTPTDPSNATDTEVPGILQARRGVVLSLLMVFSVTTFVAHTAFYLKNCVIATRYMLDYMPAFAAGILAAWLGWGTLHQQQGWRARWLAVSGAAVLLWLAWDFHCSGHSYGDPQVLTWSECQHASAQRRSRGVSLPAEGLYRSCKAPGQTGLPLNGAGWNPLDGTVMPSVILFVDSPQFLELDLAEVAGTVAPADPRQIRAKVGLEFLELEEVRPISEGWRVRFAGPGQARYQRGIQPVFLATVPREYLAWDRDLPWRLLCVRWREPAPWSSGR